MLQIAAFVGVIGSGKDYQVSKLIKADPDNWVRLDFKDELIDMCADLVGFPIRERYDEFKEFIVGFQKPHISLAHLSRQEIEVHNRQFIKDYPLAMTGRRMLQRMGTDVMRKRDPDYWINAWLTKAITHLSNGKNIACADCRFINEMLAIETLAQQSGNEAVIRFCDYHSDRYDAKSAHESEQMAQAFLCAGTKDLDLIDSGMAAEYLKD